MDNVKLRSKNWVEMLPKGPGDEDVNAIESEFFTFRGKSKTCHFLTNKVLELYLGISHSLRNEIESYIEDLAEELKTTTNSLSVCYLIFICVDSEFS
jgi:hypothetical protein